MDFGIFFLITLPTTTWVGVFFFFLISHFATSKSGDQPQEDLAKSNYKTNKEVENLEFLLHFDE
jgi:hypothetical protein